MGGIDTTAFVEEASELLSELEDSLLELEESPDDIDLISKVFRAMHTIKGSGAMFGFDDIAEFTHDVETVFDKVRNGEMSVSQELIDLTLASRDHIRALLEASATGDAVDHAEGTRIITGLRTLAGTAPPPGAAPAAEAPTPPPGAGAKDQLITYRIGVKLVPDIFANGTNPLLLLDELREMGDGRVLARTADIPPLEEIDPETCYTSWNVILTTDQGEAAIRDVFIFVEDECELTINTIDAGGEFSSPTDTKKLGEILVEKGDIDRNQLEQFMAASQPLGARLVQAGLVAPDQVETALAEQTAVKQKREKKAKTETAASIRVPSDRLDKLVDLVGELVTVQARLSQTAASHTGADEHDMTLIAEEVERLTTELRDSTMSIRMLPIGSTFNKFKRLVRDLSKELGKEIEMTTEGADTELDKTVIESLNDPLVHIIRNSIDHGIEMPDVRESNNKPRTGTVHLRAVHSGASVLIQVTDNGKGLNAEVLRKKSIERGLITEEQELTDKEIFFQIFQPGFSTAEKVTNVSGRGVGMDVVRRSIEALKGTIEIDSQLGTGTTITLKLPLTLAIIEGLLVQISDENFVLSLANVEECVELTREDLKNAHGRHVINVRGEIVPYIRLRERFQIDAEPPEVEQIVIAEVDNNRVGFVVDHVIGQHQTVIKGLGKSFQDSEEFSGATILGDGSVALIIDVQKLFRFVEQDEVAELA